MVFVAPANVVDAHSVRAEIVGQIGGQVIKRGLG